MSLTFSLHQQPLRIGHEGQLQASAGCPPQDCFGTALCPTHQGHKTQVFSSCPPHHLAVPLLSQQTFSSQKATNPTPPPCGSGAIISSHPSALSDRPPRRGKHFSKLTCECAGEEGCWLHWDSPALPPWAWGSSRGSWERTAGGSRAVGTKCGCSPEAGEGQV